MVQELHDRDVALVGGYGIEMTADRVVGVQLASLFELEDGRSGDGLRDGADVEDGRHGVRDLLLAIGEAEAGAQDHVVSSGHECGAADPACRETVEKHGDPRCGSLPDEVFAGAAGKLCCPPLAVAVFAPCNADEPDEQKERSRASSQSTYPSFLTAPRTR